MYVYILCNRKQGALYTGVTNDLIRRIHEHKMKFVDGFTKEHGIDRLIYFETFDSADSAIYREKQLKRWRRDWKIKLIEADNPDWRDLYPALLG